jgi:hypothetical protein
MMTTPECWESAPDGSIGPRRACARVRVYRAAPGRARRTEPMSLTWADRLTTNDPEVKEQ